MKTTYGSIAASQEAISVLATQPLSVSASLKVIGAIREYEKHMSVFLEARKAILKKHAKMDGDMFVEENGRVVFKSKKAEAEAQKEYSELLGTSVDFGMEKISIDAGSTKLTPLHIGSLEWLIDWNLV